MDGDAVAKDEPRVFPGMSYDDTAYRQLSGLGAGYVLKDLRRTMATGLPGSGGMRRRSAGR